MRQLQHQARKHACSCHISEAGASRGNWAGLGWGGELPKVGAVSGKASWG